MEHNDDLVGDESQGFPPAATENLDGTDEGVQGGFTAREEGKDKLSQAFEKVAEAMDNAKVSVNKWFGDRLK